MEKKGQVNKLLKSELKLNTKDDKKYIVEVICDSKIYIKEVAH